MRPNRPKPRDARVSAGFREGKGTNAEHGDIFCDSVDRPEMVWPGRFMIACADDLEQIRSFHGIWARLTMQAAPRDSRAPSIRVLTDTLRLGLDQTMQMLGRERPGLPGFVDRVLATAGPPDPAQLAR